MRLRRPPHPELSTTVRTDGTQASILLSGELDVASVDTVRRAVQDARRTGNDAIAIDLSDLDFMDAQGVLLLLGLQGDSERNGHSLALVPGSPAVQRVFDLTATTARFRWLEPLATPSGKDHPL